MKPTDGKAPWRGMTVLAVLLAGLIFVYPLALARHIPLLDPDEGIHASVAQEMVEGGDWIVPSLLGRPFLDKPILYFWAEALSLRVFGMSETAVRLPGLMFGLLGTVTTAILAWRMFGRETGLLAGLFYGTMALPVALAQAAAHDVALVPWVNLALLLFWEADHARGRRASWAYPPAIGLFLGLAVLTKGLVGAALVGVTYGSYLMLARRLTFVACLRGAAALLIGLLIGSTWYLAVELRSPGYLHYYFIERHVLGFTTDTQLHGGEPWWYYLPLLLGGGLPWIGYLPVLGYETWTQWRQKTGGEKNSLSPGNLDVAYRPSAAGISPGGSPLLLLGCWLVACTLFLSVSQSKLVTYLWPVFPAVAVLAAVTWSRLLAGSLSVAGRRMLAGTIWLSSLAGPAVLPVALLVAQGQLGFHFSRGTWAVAVITALVTLVPLGFWIAERSRVVLASAILATAAQFAVIMTVVLPPLAGELSARDLAVHFNQAGEVPPKLLLLDERLGSLLFYLDPAVRAKLQPGQLEAVKLRDLRSWQAESPIAALALAEKQVRRVKRFVNLPESGYQSAGRYRLYRASDLGLLVETACSESDRIER